MSKQMFVKLAVVLLVFIAFAAQGVQAASSVFQSPPPIPPANDNFANATVISGTYFSQSVDITEATTEAGEPSGSCGNPPQHTIWYMFTAPQNGIVSTYLWSNYASDAILNVYRADGPGVGGLSSSLGCAIFSSSIQVAVQSGVTYYFQAGMMWSAGNFVQFNMSFTPAPANDNFADAKVVTALPYDDSTDMTAAGRETNEPVPSCGSAGKTVWYAYTPTNSGSLSVRTNIYYWNVLAVYTVVSLQSLSEVSCRQWYYYESGLQTFHVDAGKTYYFQAATNDTGGMTFHLQVAEPPYPNFAFYPYDPNVFDNVYFDNYSWDPANAGISSIYWDFGDGATATEPWSPSHRYAKDGDYTVNLTVTTPDGRTASTSRTVQVRTHDVTITKFTVPQSAKAGQTRPLVVSLNSKRYVEDVQVQLLKSLPGGGWQLFGTLRQTVPLRPANRTTVFSFNYTFTKNDASIGKVTFRAIATIVNARDALPADNEAIALPTKVTP